MSFRILNDAVINALVTVSRLKIPVVGTLPIVTVGGQFIGLTTATGVDLYFYDGDTWFKLVDSSAAGGGLPNVLAINNNSGAVNNIILDNAAGAGVGALTSDSGDDLNLFAGAVNTSAPSAGTETLRLASGTAGFINVDGGTAGIDIDTAGPLTSDSASFSIDSSSAGVASNINTVGGPGVDLTIGCALGSLNLSGGEAVDNAIALSAPVGGVDITGGIAAVDAVDLNAPAGGISVTAGIAAIVALDIDTPAGGVAITAGLAAEDAVDIDAPAGGVDITAGIAAADAVDIDAPAGGIDVDCSTGFTLDVAAGGMSLDAAAASNVSTSAGDMTVATTGALATDQLVLNSAGTGVAAIDVNATGGGIRATYEATNTMEVDSGGTIITTHGTAALPDLTVNNGDLTIGTGTRSFNFTGTGTVTQTTSNTTGVTLNTTVGRITMFGTVATATDGVFVVTNSTVAGTSTIFLTAQAIGVTDGRPLYVGISAIAAGSFSVVFRNDDTGATTAAPIIHYMVINPT